jgi:hypothetical protein
MAQMEPGNVTRSSRWLFRGTLCLLAWIVFELACYCVIAFSENNGLAGVRELQSSFRDRGVLRSSQSETFHPYVGWTHNPDLVPKQDCCGLELRTNRFGFFDIDDGIHKKSADRLIVAISGGSVAWQMSCAGANVLVNKLLEIPAYRNRHIQFVRLAQSGYKQPQGLFALTYYLLQGGEFDIVINLDGYNEIALPTCENFQAHVALDYPQGWHARTRDVVDPRDADISLRIFEIRGMRQRAAIAALDSPLRNLPSYQAMWLLQEQRLALELMEIERGLLTRSNERQRGFIHAGPKMIATTSDEALAEAIRFWKQSSIQMHRICSANQIRYLHAIQPNQYDIGSKPLSEFEQEKCYSETIEYGHMIKKGYPVLRAEGQSLQGMGISFCDLTLLFTEVTETLYVDPYCHVNQKGSELLAEAVGEALKLSSELPRGE